MAFVIHDTTAHHIYTRLLQAPRLGAYLQQIYHHHPETYDHSQRVALLALDLGLENQLSFDWLDVLGQAALLHDIGKLRIPPMLLDKAGQLTFQEVTLLRSHARLGREVLQDYYPPAVAQIVGAHHAYDESPYPRAGYPIPVTGPDVDDRRPDDPLLDALAQMLAAADMFDALKHRRAYKGACSFSETRRTLKKQYLGNWLYLHQVLARGISGTTWA
ncbi:MAG: HD-GYP domain-containing protein [Anaerolineales bacterium]|jgi:putative nucleotidyltransferase with HDIG domain